MDPEEFRAFGHQLVDWVADYRARLRRLPVRSSVEPGEIRRRFPAAPPRDGGHLAEAIAALDRDVLPGITHWNHPGFFAYFPSVMSPAAVLADLVSAGLGAQGMSWETSPAATEIEEVMMEWLRQIVDLPATFSGVIHDTASTATLCALICARERAIGDARRAAGLQGGGPPLIVYASDQAHSSVDKAARLAGFGRDHLRLIASDDAHALRLDALAEAMDRDVAGGARPCAIVATTGTTGTTALDPIAGIAELAGRHGAWLHVDAAMAGVAMALPECRWMWAGVEHADSLVLNPHKWMGVGCDLSAYYVRDPQHLIRVMGTDPSYLRTAHDREVKNFRDWGIPLGRRFRALKLWFLLMDIGVEGLQARLRRDLANAQWLKGEVEAAPDWDLLAPVVIQTVVLRHRPPGVSDEARLTGHNLAIAARVNGGGRAYLTPSLLKGRQTLRVSIGAEDTGRPDVEALWEELKRAAEHSGGSHAGR
jgi:aromatic-L-amino-acid decarboxylase